MRNPDRLFAKADFISKNLYLISFALLIIFEGLASTTFTLNIPGAAFALVRAGLFSAAMMRILLYLRQIPKSTLLTLVLFMGLGIFFMSLRADTMVLDMALAAAGAYRVDWRQISEVYLFTQTFIILLALVSSRTGVIADYTFRTNYGEKERMRHSFGIIYPTDMYAHVFYIALVYFIRRWKKITYAEIGAAAAIFGVLYVFTSARAGFAEAVLLIVIMIIVKAKRFGDLKLQPVIKKAAAVIFMPLCALLITSLTYLYNEQNPFLNRLDALSSYRLSLGKTGMGLYGFKLLGNMNFAENGNANGGIRNYTYIFYDSAYIKYLYKYGIALLIVLFAVYALIGLKLVQKGESILFLPLMIVAASFIIEHHMLELSYNITLLLLTADISTILQSRESVNKSARNDIL